jgi:hypothetical protein
MESEAMTLHYFITYARKYGTELMSKTLARMDFEASVIENYGKK